MLPLSAERKFLVSPDSGHKVLDADELSFLELRLNLVEGDLNRGLLLLKPLLDGWLLARSEGRGRGDLDFESDGLVFCLHSFVI